MLLQWSERSGLNQVKLASVTQLSTTISALGKESSGEKSNCRLQGAVGGFHKDTYFETLLIWQVLTASHESQRYMTHFLHSCITTNMEEYVTFSS